MVTTGSVRRKNPKALIYLQLLPCYKYSHNDWSQSPNVMSKVGKRPRVSSQEPTVPQWPELGGSCLLKRSRGACCSLGLPLFPNSLRLGCFPHLSPVCRLSLHSQKLLDKITVGGSPRYTTQNLIPYRYHCLGTNVPPSRRDTDSHEGAEDSNVTGGV